MKEYLKNTVRLIVPFKASHLLLALLVFIGSSGKNWAVDEAAGEKSARVIPTLAFSKNFIENLSYSIASGDERDMNSHINNELKHLSEQTGIRDLVFHDIRSQIVFYDDFDLSKPSQRNMLTWSITGESINYYAIWPRPIRELLFVYKLDPNERNGDGLTPLDYAYKALAWAQEMEVKAIHDGNEREIRKRQLKVKLAVAIIDDLIKAGGKTAVDLQK